MSGRENAQQKGWTPAPPANWTSSACWPSQAPGGCWHQSLCSPFTISSGESSVLDMNPSFQKLVVRRGAAGRKPQSGRGVAPLDNSCRPMGGLGSFWNGGLSRRESRAELRRMHQHLSSHHSSSLILLTFYAESPTTWGVSGSWYKHWGTILPESWVPSAVFPGKFLGYATTWWQTTGVRPLWFNYTGREAVCTSAALRDN